MHDRTDVVRAVSDSPFFQAMAEEDRVTFAQLGTLRDHDAGAILFRPRELPSALYLVVRGVVEISRRETSDGELEPVAYLGAGATLAASKVVTGNAFEALARFPAGGQTVQWPRTAVLRKLASSRGFGMQYLHNLARRLERSFAGPAGRTGSKLGGRLDHFDLATILQTVVEAGAPGVLEVLDAGGATFGSIYTADRRIGPMVCGPLSGPSAFFEIMVAPPERGTFTFSTVRAPLAAGRRHELPPLLFEAARMQDEYRRFQSEMPGHVRLRASGRRPESGPDGASELTARVWRTLAVRPAGWESLAERLPYSRVQVALAVRDMLRHGTLAVEDATTAAGGTA